MSRHSLRQLLLYGYLLPTVAFVLLLFHPHVCLATPLIRVSIESIPLLIDDLDRKGLETALDKSLKYLNTLPKDIMVNMADRKVPVQIIADSLKFFRTLLASELSDEELQKRIGLYFDIFQAAGTSGLNPNHDMLVTGYFQPVLDGSLVKKPPYLYPIYSVPPDLVIKRANEPEQQQIGRFENGRFTRYWTRKEIDLQGKAAGNEIVWLKDPLDVFFLQVQGSGLIQLRNGTLRGIHYAAKNGLPYRSIGKYMVKTGRISIEEASAAAIRNYMENNPDELQQILFMNPSYIFFDWSEGYGAKGSLGQDLTPGRSIAVDLGCFPPGSLAFLSSRQPVVQSGQIVSWKPVHRFVLAQDTGSAIKGPGRVDLFLGKGEQAGMTAGFMKETGSLYFILLRSKIQ